MPNERPWRGSGLALTKTRPVVRSRQKTDARITTCKLCPRGVFTHQEWTWSTGAVLGIVHTACLEARDGHRDETGGRDRD